MAGMSPSIVSNVHLFGQFIGYYGTALCIILVLWIITKFFSRKIEDSSGSLQKETLGEKSKNGSLKIGLYWLGWMVSGFMLLASSFNLCFKLLISICLFLIN